jgi:hypothetical protein
MLCPFNKLINKSIRGIVMIKNRCTFVMVVLTVFMVSGCATTHSIKLNPPLEGLDSHPKAAVSVGAYYSTEFRNFELRRASGAGWTSASVGKTSKEMFEGMLPMVFEKVTPVEELPPYGLMLDDMLAVIAPSIEDFDFMIPLEKDKESNAITYRLTIHNMAGVPVTSWTVKGSSVPPGGWNRTPLIELDMKDAANKILAQLSERFNDQKYVSLLESSEEQPVVEGAEHPIALQARLFNDPVKQQELLGLDLDKVGVTVIHVFARNQSTDKAYTVRPSDIQLEFADGSSCKPECTVRIASKYEGVGGATAAVLLINPLAGLGPGRGNIKVRTESKEKIQIHKISERTLEPGEKVEGYLFFVLPEDKESIEDANLAFWAVEDGTARGARVKLPVTVD